MLNPFIDVINQILPEPHAGLLNGILFGIKSQLPQDFYKDLLTTGTVHIIALSGQNISIIENVLSEITIPLGRRRSILITMLFIVLFILFVGVQASLIRAALMGSLSLIAVYFGRKNWSLLSLFIAAGIMLIIHPEWLAEISFQLSFLATLGIILLSKNQYIKASNMKGELLNDLKISLRTTLAAQIFTLPVVLINFRRMSLISPVANILIAPVITPIMILGFITSISGFIYIPFGYLLSWLIWPLLEYLVLVVSITAKIPLASIQW